MEEMERQSKDCAPNADWGMGWEQEGVSAYINKQLLNKKLHYGFSFHLGMIFCFYK